MARTITNHNSVVIPMTGHTANETGWNGDDTDHWHVCATCGETFDMKPIVADMLPAPSRLLVEVCGQKYGSTTAHDYQWNHSDTQHWKACKDCKHD